MIKEKKKSFILVIPTICSIFMILFALNIYYVIANNDNNYITADLFDQAFINFFKNPFKNIHKDIMSLWIFIIGIILAAILLIKTKQLHKRNVQENTHGSARWGHKKDMAKLREKNELNNLILLKDYQISRNMIKSMLTRHVLLVAGPGKGKSRGYFKPNILNAKGSMIISDPKKELLRDCGSYLKQRGYRIIVLDVEEMWKSNKYNPLYYIRKLPKEAYSIDSFNEEFEYETLKDDDVLNLINNIFKSTDGKVQKSGDPFWEKAEMLLDQSVFFYVLYKLPENERNFTSVMELLREGIPDEDGNSKLRARFESWRLEEPNHIGIKQWDHFMTAKGQMQSTIMTTAVARLASFNVQQLADITSDDEMNLDDLGAPGERGKIAIFIVTKPANDTFRYFTNIFWTQLFQMLDTNASKYDGYLPTPVDVYLDEWAQLGEIPFYLENLAYLRGLNVGITTGLQSISQLKKVYKDNWEDVLDCVDSILFMGGNSEKTLKWISDMLGKKTYYKRSSGGSGGAGKGSSSSYNWDVVGRELATIDEVRRLKKDYGILIISGYHPFYGKIYNLKEHSNYKYLYEPRNSQKTITNKYDHFKYLKEIAKADKQIKMLKSMGISGDIIRDELIPFDISELNKFKIINEIDLISEQDSSK